MQFNRVLFLLLLFGACRGGPVYRQSARHMVLHFPYGEYVGKNYGEFYRDFTNRADKKGIAMTCEMNYSKVPFMDGTRFQVGHGWKVITLFNINNRIDYNDTASRCYECTCPEYDTTKITGFRILKNLEVIREISKKSSPVSLIPYSPK